MNRRLQSRSRAASRAAVLGRLLSIVLTVALLWGSALSPAIAHARGGGAEHSAEVLQLGPVASAHDSEPADDGGNADQAATHHHCTIAVEAEAPAVEPATILIRETVVPGLSHILGSLAQAPPVEPPAA